MGNSDADHTSSMLQFIAAIESFVTKLSQPQGSTSSPSSSPFIPDRRTVGSFVRELGVKPPFATGKPLSSKWPLAVLLSFVIEASSIVSRSHAPFVVPIINNPDLQPLLARYKKFNDVVLNYGVEEAYALKPILNVSGNLRSLSENTN
jgi:hypothetical protein